MSTEACLQIDLRGVETAVAARAPATEIYPGVVKRELWQGRHGANALLLAFAPGARFTELDRHAPGPEEILVLSGVFSDGVHSYEAGTFLHCPAGSAHLPQSAQGCVLFVFFPEG